MPEGSETPEPTNVLFTPRARRLCRGRDPGRSTACAQVLVTDEPHGGRDTPTGDVLISADTS